MKYSRIVGTGACLPEKVVANADLEKMVDTSDDWIRQRVGIIQRHIVSGGETTISLALHAARKAIEAAQLQPNDIDLVIVGTATNNFYFPSVASIVQGELGITNECAAFDVSAACAGFIYAMSIADQYLRSGSAKNVLVIGVDVLSKIVDWTDRNTCVLFGDGAGAVVLQSSKEKGLLTTHIHASGQYAKLLYCESGAWHRDSLPFVKMDGAKVFKIAVSKLNEIVDQTLTKAGIEKSAIDWLIPHQANMRIIQATAKRLNLPMERVVLTIQHHGNTSAASVPLALDHAIRQGVIKRGDTLMLEAFGAGLAWGSALLVY